MEEDEDIKILEELKKDFDEILKEPIGQDELYNGNLYEYERGYELDLKQIQAIQNLIARYKELEEENKILKNKQTKIIADSFHEKMAQKFNEEFITKKRVKEKIEDLEKRGYFEEANAMKELLKD